MVCTDGVFVLAKCTNIKLYLMGTYATCAQILSLAFLVLAEVILSGGNEGSLLSGSDESDDELELSQGTVLEVFLCFESG